MGCEATEEVELAGHMRRVTFLPEKETKKCLIKRPTGNGIIAKKFEKGGILEYVFKRQRNCCVLTKLSLL